MNREQVTGGHLMPAIAFLSLPAAVLAGMIFGIEAGIALFAFGLLSSPIPILVGKSRAGVERKTGSADSLELVKNAYVSGNIDETELEREIEHTIESSERDDDNSKNMTYDVE